MTDRLEDTRYNFWWREHPGSQYRLSLEMAAKMGDVHNHDEWVDLWIALDKCRVETLRQIKQKRNNNLTVLLGNEEV